MKIDFHVHSYFSDDSYQKFEDIIKKIEKAGLDGVVILDHNTIKGGELLKTYLDQYYENVSIENRVVAIRAGEYSTEEGHIIVIGLTTPLEDILTLQNQWYKCEEVISASKAQGATIVLAHPYRWKKRVPSDWLLSQVDAIEVFNGRTCFVKNNFEANAKAMALAKRLNLPIVGGSDAHFTAEVGRSYVEFDVPKEAFDPQRLNRYASKVFGQYTPPHYEVASQIYKFLCRKKYHLILKQIVKLAYSIGIVLYAKLKPDLFLTGEIGSYSPKTGESYDRI